MRIAVVGAGAMGGLFGGRLALGGNDVCLIDVDRGSHSGCSEKRLLIDSESSVECAGREQAWRRISMMLKTS